MQLLMIRAQGIEPRTCPAYAKFKLFNSLRRYILIFFVIHTFIIVSQVFNLSQAASVALLVLWELLQLVVTFVIGCGAGSRPWDLWVMATDLCPVPCSSTLGPLRDGY